MENLGTLSKHQRKIISKELLKEKERKKSVAGNNYLSEKAEFEAQLNKVAYSYYNFKLSHNGLISYKQFENCTRHVRAKSLDNLLHYSSYEAEMNDSSKPFDSCLGFINPEPEYRRQLSEKQSKACKKMCNKLVYYSKNRQFLSKKSGKYNFRTAFITLGAPESTTISQFLKAFDLFLDYLRRTANCVFVWKKEFGGVGNHLHVHILVNNFIPYYIIDWKWKRLLISQGVVWPKNKKGQDTSAHYRIELPRNAKSTGGYIAKYMAKVAVIDENIGYLWGKSKVLSDLKEIVLIEGEVNYDELYSIYSKFKTIGNEFVKICLVNFMKVNSIAPELYSLFKAQFFEFQSKISLPQRFQVV